MGFVSGSTKRPTDEIEDGPSPLRPAASEPAIGPEPALRNANSDFDALAALAAAAAGPPGQFVAPAAPAGPDAQRSPVHTPGPTQDPTGPTARPGSRPDGASANSSGPHLLGTAWGQLIDSLAGDVLLTHVPGRRVLDLGHGSPEIAQWVAARVEHLSIVEKSALDQPGRIAEVSGFLPASDLIDEQGNLRIDESGVTPLRLNGFPEAVFDVVYCLRTYPHLGFDATSSERLAAQVLREAARVTTNGGSVFIQIANPRSLRGIVEGIRNPITVVSRRRMILGDRFGLTRWDTLGRFRRVLPPELEFVRVHGLGVTIPHDATLAVPLLGALLSRLEWRLRDMGVVRRFGALLLVELRRLPRQARVR